MRTLAAALLLPVAAAPAAAQTNARAALEGLLAADRQFAAAAARSGVADGIVAAFAPDVTLSIRGRFADGRAAALAALREAPSYQGAHARWRPIGGTVSADGRHGFTTGYLDIDGAADKQHAGRRYLAYWVRRPEGWRIAVYRQALRPAGQPTAQVYAPALPVRRSRAPGAAAASLRAAEQGFSDRAQRVGLQAAFRELGRPDAVHVAGDDGFRIGLPAITATMPSEVPATLVWSADRVIVAGSGDLGVTIGRIHPTHHAAGERANIPFFTVWRRDPGGPWRYIAE